MFQASRTELEAAGLAAVSVQSTALEKSFSGGKEEFRKARDVVAEIIPFQDVRYPDLLKRIYDPPLALYGSRRFQYFVFTRNRRGWH